MAEQQVYVIIGASRGIGLEYVKQLATLTPPPIVYATARDISTATELNSVASSHNNVRVVVADLAKAGSLQQLASTIEKQESGVDTLVVTGAQWVGGRVTEDIDKAVSELIEVNAIGPIRALRALLPLLRKRSTKRVVFLSSSSGSITMNDPSLLGVINTYQTPYHISKTTLNGLVRQVANDLKPEGFTVIPLCPGIVQTAMSATSFTTYPPEVIAASPLASDPRAVPQTPTESVQRQLKVIDGLIPENTGKFYSHLGEVYPW